MNLRHTIFGIFLLLSNFVCAQQIDSITSANYHFYLENDITVQDLVPLREFIETQYYQKNYEVAISLGPKTIAFADRQDSTSTAIKLASFVGNAFLKSGDSLSANNVLRQNVLRAEDIDEPKNLLTTKIDLGNYYAVQKNIPSAIDRFTESIVLAEELQDTASLFILHNNISELFLERNDLSESIAHVQKTNEFAEALKSPYYSSAAIYLSGRLKYLQGNAEEAIIELERAALLAESVNFDEALIQIYDYLSKAHVLNGNFEKAFEALTQHNQIQAKSYESEKIQAIETVTAQYKLDQFQQELKEQSLQAEIDQQAAKTETTIFWVKIAATILFISGSILFFSYLKRRRLLKDLVRKNKQYVEEKERSEELSRAKNILFSKFTHELRTPMYGIIGISSTLLDNEKFEQESESLNSLKFSADYLLSLINNILQFNKIDSINAMKENNQGKKSVFHLKDLIDNCIRSARYLNTEHPNQYLVKLDASIPPYLKGDETMLTQILMNLMCNSTKFTHDGKIDLIVEQKQRIGNGIELSFTIKDNGMGISQEQQESVFEDFSQIEQDQNLTGGTGLGLPIVKRLLELNNSQIHLQSALGEGTTIDFDLKFEVGETPNECGTSEINNKNLLRDRRILAVDDNKINLMVTQRVIKSYGGTCDTALGGQEAIDLVHKNVYDLILMDINMPNMNGFEATTEIRQINSSIPIIALTAVEKERVVDTHSFHLMDDILIKPYANEDFISTLVKNI